MMQLTQLSLSGGLWRGVLTGAGTAPELVAHLGETLLPTPQVTEADEGFVVELPVPSEAIGDGVQVISVSTPEGEVLASFAVAAGDVLQDDLRAEVQLLRAELALLKSAFRRHCRDG